jgi:hypothetical protein
MFQMLFKLADPYFYKSGPGSQIIDMPMGGNGGMHMMLKSGSQTTGSERASNIGVITGRETTFTQLADGNNFCTL